MDDISSSSQSKVPNTSAGQEVSPRTVSDPRLNKIEFLTFFCTILHNIYMK